jgi:uncharacterized protein YndB with AHSA1/START domain
MWVRLRVPCCGIRIGTTPKARRKRGINARFRIIFMKITVSTRIAAPIAEVWRAYTSPQDVLQWNAASADWHTTAAAVDLRVGGKFSSRMEARDGSFGFDFEGEYTHVEAPHRLEYVFGERGVVVEFSQTLTDVTVTVTFDAESEHPEEAQRAGWQSILDNFARHMLALQGAR